MEKQKYIEDMVGTPSKTIKPRRLRVKGPDGREAWCVAFAAFVINFIMAGLSRMSGILYVAFIEMFHIDRKGASMPFSVRSSTMNLLGPVVGIIGQKYSVRSVSIVGGVLGTLSAAACFFVEDIGWITFIWGGINGVGTALATTLITVILSQYFQRHKTTASGMAFSGGCVGSFVFPPLVEELLHLYGLEGTFLIIGGIIMHCIPAAMILRKPQWIKDVRHKASGDVESLSEMPLNNSKLVQSAPSQQSIDIAYLKRNSNLVLNILKPSNPDKSENEKESQEIMREMENAYSVARKTPLSLKLSELPAKMRIQSECEKSPVCKSKSFQVSCVGSPGKAQPANNPKTSRMHWSPFILGKLKEIHSKNDSQITASMEQPESYTKVLKELRMLHKLLEVVKRPSLFCNVSSSRPRKTTSKEKNEADSTVWVNVKNSVKLHGNPMFLLIALCRAVHFTTFIPVVTVIVDYVMDKGLVEEDGKYVIAALSIGDLIGRLCFGWVTDRGYITLPKYMLLVMVLQGMLTSAIPFFDELLFLLPVIILYALLQGSVFVRHTVLVSKYMRSDKQSIAMGCVNFFAGVLGFAVPYYVGFFRDTMGSYDGIFYLNGIIGAITGLLWILEPYFGKSSEKDMQVENQKV